MTRQSPIVRSIARFAVPLSLLVAARIFLQGHDLPGGGFIAGVLLAAAGAMYMIAFGSRRVVPQSKSRTSSCGSKPLATWSTATLLRKFACPLPLWPA